MSENEQIKNILTRLEKLEKAVFSVAKQPRKAKEIGQDFSGAKGGVLFLVSRGYFSQGRFAPDVRTELGKNGYHYSIQVVQTALNRLSKGKVELVAMKNGSKKTYVKRK